MRFLLLFMYFFHGLVLANSNVITLTAEQINNLGIELSTLKTAPQIPVLYAPAKVVVPPKNEYIVSAGQAGLIKKLAVGLGDEIQQGDLLAEIDSPDLLALQSQFLKAQTALNLARTVYQRDQALVKAGVIAFRREQESQSQYQAVLVEFNSAKQSLLIAGMHTAAIQQLSKSQQLNSTLKVYAMAKGVVLKRLVSLGERVDNLTPLYHLADLSELWLRINIPQERINDVHIGDKVAVDHAETSGFISALGKSVEANDQTLLARAVIKGKPMAIHVGQNVTVQVYSQNSSKQELAQFIVPNTAIIQHENNAFVFVRVHEGFVLKPVQVLGKQNEDVIMTGALTSDEQIVSKGTVALKAIWLAEQEAK